MWWGGSGCASDGTGDNFLFIFLFLVFLLFEEVRCRSVSSWTKPKRPFRATDELATATLTVRSWGEVRYDVLPKFDPCVCPLGHSFGYWVVRGVFSLIVDPAGVVEVLHSFGGPHLESHFRLSSVDLHVRTIDWTRWGVWRAQLQVKCLESYGSCQMGIRSLTVSLLSVPCTLVPAHGRPPPRLPPFQFLVSQVTPLANLQLT